VMSKSIFEIEIERMQTELHKLEERANNIDDDDIYNSKRTYIVYKIEMLKKDILIEQLMLPARQKVMLQSPPQVLIDKTLIDGVYISKQDTTELLEALGECDSVNYLKETIYGVSESLMKKLYKVLGGKE